MLYYKHPPEETDIVKRKRNVKPMLILLDSMFYMNDFKKNINIQ